MGVAGGAAGGGFGPLTSILSTTFTPDQAVAAACATADFCSIDAAVPIKITLSTLTVRLKSGMGALALKTGPAFVKSSALASGLIQIWSMTLTSGVSEPLSAFISAALAESSGSRR